MSSPVRKIAVFATWLLCTNLLADERASFEGQIHFRIEVEILDSRVTPDMVAPFGTELVVFYRSNGDILRIWPDAEAEWELYNANENTQVAKIRGNDSYLLLWDGASEDRSLTSVRKERTSESALGRSLDVVTIEYDDGSTTRYWFDPTLYSDPSPHQDLQFAHQNRYWELAQSPILRYERTNELYRITHVPTKIEIGPVPMDRFDLPSLPVRKWDEQ